MSVIPWLLAAPQGDQLGRAERRLASRRLGAGLALFIGAAIILYRSEQTAPDASDVEVGQPALARFLFTSARSVPSVGVRLYLGYEWFEAGRHKLGDPAWMEGGRALRGFWERAVAVPEQGRPPITYDPYREYIQFMLDQGWYDWFAKVVAVGELLIGIGLILGALTGIAAFTAPNMSFMLAGTVSTNPVLFTLSILIVLACARGRPNRDCWAAAGPRRSLALVAPGGAADREMSPRPT